MVLEMAKPQGFAIRRIVGRLFIHVRCARWYVSQRYAFSGLFFNGVKEGLMHPVGERVETFLIAGLCLDGLFRLTGWSLG